MRLSNIKLAGFKSFVDPTHIALPGQLVGVVGPNGCGKSNVIDALRWVLGESKASALRGESMQDVIFNGSVQRKPVARASVELVFDNTQSKAAGQWASYAEISIRRVLKRDGESSYYINNQHVRRKDVTDIFLGTGLGGRAYAIIEQGMISRIIEAKPEELRVFLEEAAGVSRYRDRRRDTESRLADTRDNLLRVDDVLQELDAQLLRLAEQAEVAKLYRALEQRRDNSQKLLWMVKRQEAAVRRAKFAQDKEQAKIELESETARLREVETQLETARAAHYRQADELHVCQGELYEANAEVLRLEQQIAHLAVQRQRIGQQIASNERLVVQQQAQLQAVMQKQAHWMHERSAASDRLSDAERHAAAEAVRLPEFEATTTNAQSQFSDVQRERLSRQQQVELAESQRALLQRAIQQLESRRSRLLLEQANLPKPDMAGQERAQTELAALESSSKELQQRLTALQAQLPQADIVRRNLRTAAVQQERVLAQIEARLTALQQLQQTLDTDQALKSWLAKYGLQAAPRLWQALRVVAGWDSALEAVLRERLNAIRFDVGTALPEPAPARVAMYLAGRAGRVPAVPQGLRSLRSLIECDDAVVQAVLDDWLAAVYVADSLEEARARKDELPTGSSFVTPQGHQVSAHGVAFHAPDSALHGVLARQREIELLEGEAQEQRAHLEAVRQQATAAERAHADIEAHIAPLRQQVNEAQQRLHGLQMQALKLAQANERNIERAGQLDRELQEMAASLDSELAQQQVVAARLEASRHALTGLEVQAAQAQRHLGEQESALRQQRGRTQQGQQALQEARHYAQTCADKLTDMAQERERIEVSLAQIEYDRGLFRDELAALPDEQVQQALQLALTLRAQREVALTSARNALEQATAGLSRLEGERMRGEQRLPPLRDRVAELTLKEQEARLQFEQWAEQLQGVDEATLQPQLEGAHAAGLQAEVTRLSDEIEALGAVNLAALEELKAGQERKAWLEAQAADLREAMNTLEAAIRRIDKESRDLLMDTYDAVNRHLAELFPVLFAGGEARLVLTGEEILDSGVQVMAQPPGKKNSSIHLLSGGEKALTAIALVFSLFQLNPAPFCLLDEVDAPLDDTNTERLCQLIKKMSTHTQFVFISHNKITMELAQQLVGVTMQEKGVSKVVAVDIEEALKLAEEAPGFSRRSTIS